MFTLGAVFEVRVISLISVKLEFPTTSKIVTLYRYSLLSLSKSVQFIEVTSVVYVVVLTSPVALYNLKVIFWKFVSVTDTLANIELAVFEDAFASVGSTNSIPG